MRDPELASTLLLVKNGVPFDVAFSLPEVDRIAWSIIMGQLEGGKFNLDTWEWERPQN